MNRIRLEPTATHLLPELPEGPLLVTTVPLPDDHIEGEAVIVLAAPRRCRWEVRKSPLIASVEYRLLLDTAKDAGDPGEHPVGEGYLVEVIRIRLEPRL